MIDPLADVLRRVRAIVLDSAQLPDSHGCDAMADSLGDLWNEDVVEEIHLAVGFLRSAADAHTDAERFFNLDEAEWLLSDAERLRLERRLVKRGWQRHPLDRHFPEPL